MWHSPTSGSTLYSIIDGMAVMQEPFRAAFHITYGNLSTSFELVIFYRVDQLKPSTTSVQIVRRRKKKTEKKQEDRQCGNKPNHWPLAETNAHFLRYSSAKALQKINILIYTEQDQVLRLKAQTTLITGDYSSVTIQDSQMAKLDLLPGRVVLINEQNKELKLKTLSLSLNLPPLLTN